MMKKSLDIFLAAPRGFCAGVDRAIKIVEKALEKYGPPVYVRHEIVHNKYVVQSLEKKGAIFVEELDEIPDKYPVIFSAHGVPKSIPLEAQKREFLYVDATCPLVSKVHREAEKLHAKGYEIILIGHTGHPEVIGTIGQLPEGAIKLIETKEDAEALSVENADMLAYITQTTLSVDDTIDIINTLRERFPNIAQPKQEDICYATTNRQESVKNIAERCDAVIVLGAPNSSNSMRLVEVALKYGSNKATLLQRASEIDWDWLEDVKTLGITAGASAPEILVQEVLEAIQAKYETTIHQVTTTSETIEFKLPKILAA